MITIVLLDDEKTHLSKSESILKSSLLDTRIWDNEYKTVTFAHSKELIEFSLNERIDILILDIHMPEPNGLAVAEHFHEKYPDTRIIFLSSYEQYVFFSIRFAPFRFVRKSKIETELPEAVINAVLSFSEKQKHLDISNSYNQQKIPFSWIMYVQKIKGKNYIEICCTNETYTGRQSISTLEKQLCPHGFTKINSSMIVNMQYIHHINGDDVYLQNGSQFKISRGCSDTVKVDFLKYIRSNTIE